MQKIELYMLVQLLPASNTLLLGKNEKKSSIISVSVYTGDHILKSNLFYSCINIDGLTSDRCSNLYFTILRPLKNIVQTGNIQHSNKRNVCSAFHFLSTRRTIFVRVETCYNNPLDENL